MSPDSAPPGRPRRVAASSSSLAVSALAAAVAVGLLAAGCADAGGAGAGGAAAPAKAGTGVPAASGSASPTRTSRDDYSGNGAERVVAAYFQEINDASRAGRVADVSATALPGCQPCALDVGMTRLFDQRGLRADVAPYELSGLTATDPVGAAATVRFTATVHALRLLDPAGREAGAEPAVPTRTGSAELTLAAAGWRILTIRYTTGTS
jgi:hypothetical protein